MESTKNVMNMPKPGMFFSSIDIKDAFHSVLIFLRYKKKNIWKGKMYHFLAMPNGYNDGV